MDDDETEKEKKLSDNDKPSKDEAKAMVKEEPSDGTVKAEDGAAAEAGGGTAEKDKKVVSLSLADAVRDEMDRLMEDNKRLQNTVTEIHQCHRELTLKVGEALLSRLLWPNVSAE